jgi:hypothetical protein
MYGFSHRVSRPVTSELLDGLDQGLYNAERMVQDLLGWMSESEVARFARANEYLMEEDEE